MSETSASDTGETTGEGGEVENLVELTDQLEDVGQGEKVELRDIVDEFGARGYGPLLLVPSLIALSPAGAIPGMSVTTGAMIFVVATQILIGRSRPWLPEKLLSVSISRDKLESGMQKFEPWARRIDKLIRKRWSWAIEPPARHVTALLSLCLAASMYPLALIPFAVAVPSLFLTLLSFAITFRDGLWAVVGWTGVGAVAYLMWSVT